MIRRLSLALFCAFVATTQAAGPSASVAWTAPTTYVDGTPMPASDIKNFTVSWSRSVGGPVLGSVTDNASPAIVPTPCGNYFFTVSVTTTATAVYPNTTSAPSAIASYASGVACTPSPVTNVTVQ